MTVVPSISPFTRLKLRDAERLQWVGYNPTFHRYRVYGLALSDTAFYVYAPAWLFGRWRRYPLSEVSDVALNDSGSAIRFRMGEKTVTFRPPFDSHADEAQFDRAVMAKAVELLGSK